MWSFCRYSIQPQRRDAPFDALHARERRPRMRSSRFLIKTAPSARAYPWKRLLQISSAALRQFFCHPFYTDFPSPLKKPWLENLYSYFWLACRPFQFLFSLSLTSIFKSEGIMFYNNNGYFLTNYLKIKLSNVEWKVPVPSFGTVFAFRIQQLWRRHTYLYFWVVTPLWLH